MLAAAALAQDAGVVPAATEELEAGAVVAGAAAPLEELGATGAARRRPARRLRGGPGDCDPPCPLQPTADIELEPGVHVFSAIDVPAGVTVRAPGALVLHVTGPVDVAGTLAADCGALEVHALGEVTITGTLDNRCPGDAAGAGGLVIHTEGGNRITIGTPEITVPLLSNGGLDISNDSTFEDWEFDVLPFQRSASSVAPVCSAFAGPLAGPAIAGMPFVVRFEGHGADPDGGPVALPVGLRRRRDLDRPGSRSTSTRRERATT